MGFHGQTFWASPKKHRDGEVNSRTSLSNKHLAFKVFSIYLPLPLFLTLIIAHLIVIVHMASSASSLNNPINSHSNFPFSNQFMTSFTDLLSNNKNMDQENELRWGLSDLKSDRNGNEIPKFKSLPPPSLPLSPPPLSPSSYLAFPTGLSPTEFLMSPLFGSNYNVSYELHSPHICFDVCWLSFTYMHTITQNDKWVFVILLCLCRIFRLQLLGLLLAKHSTGSIILVITSSLEWSWKRKRSLISLSNPKQSLQLQHHHPPFSLLQAWSQTRWYVSFQITQFLHIFLMFSGYEHFFIFGAFSLVRFQKLKLLVLKFWNRSSSSTN